MHILNRTMAYHANKQDAQFIPAGYIEEYLTNMTTLQRINEDATLCVCDRLRRERDREGWVNDDTSSTLIIYVEDTDLIQMLSISTYSLQPRNSRRRREREEEIVKSCIVVIVVI